MTNRKTDIPSVLKHSVSFIISFGCTFFVCYQSYNCVEKFLNHPQGTRMSIEFIGNTSTFPAMTVCPDPDKENDYGFRYNESFLDYCGIRR